MIAGKTETKNQPNAGTLVAVKKIVPFRREKLFFDFVAKKESEIPDLRNPKHLGRAQKQS